jgi:Zn-dependent peptidase ImmA (M78 family)
MARRPRASIEDRAHGLLDKLGIQSIPTPVRKIARSLGAQLRYSPLDDELSGMIYVKDGVPIIGVNSLHHENRQRFTIGHEIGHLCLHPTAITEVVHVDKRFAESVLRRDSTSATGTERREIEANQFAAALLIPKQVLEERLGDLNEDVEDEYWLEELAKQFKVSKSALQYRIRNLYTGLLAPE